MYTYVYMCAQINASVPVCKLGSHFLYQHFYVQKCVYTYIYIYIYISRVGIPHINTYFSNRFTHIQILTYVQIHTPKQFEYRYRYSHTYKCVSLMPLGNSPQIQMGR